MDPTAAVAKMKKIEPAGARPQFAATIAPTPDTTQVTAVRTHTFASNWESIAPTVTLPVSSAPAIDCRMTRERCISLRA